MTITEEEPSPVQFKTLEVTLNKLHDNEPLGLSLATITDAPGIYIRAILSNSAASRDGTLANADRLIKVRLKDAKSFRNRSV